MTFSGSVREALTQRLTAPHTDTSISIPGMTGHRIQIAVAQQKPAGWKLFTERDGDTVRVFRWS